MELRSYQKRAASKALALIEKDPDASPLLVLPTGAGKTVIMGHMTEHLQGRAVQAAIAHRRELVSQIALAYARYGIPHRIVGPDATVRESRAVQLHELGRSLIDDRAPVGVCSVDTLIAREQNAWMRSVTVAHWDEAHHVLRENKWGRGAAMFPSLRHSFGYTATPRRADRKGLGLHSDGVFTDMVEGPTMRELIRSGFLTDYRLITGDVADLDLSDVLMGSNNDYSPQGLRKAVKRSRQIVGDAVATYQQYCPGVRAVLFAADVEDAMRYREAFNGAGIPAEVVTAETDPGVRREAIRNLRGGVLKVLINVDLFGEGFDLPAIECVIMVRPTKSLPLYHQQFGRALRLVIEKGLMKQWDSFTDTQRLDAIARSEKPRAIIIDLVKNWAEPACGGLPDALGRVWTLDGSSKRGGGAPDDAIPLRACTNPIALDASGQLCTGVYERFLEACPHCGWVPVPERRTVEQVDGDPAEISAELLARLRGEIAQAVATPAVYGPHAAAVHARHRERFSSLEQVKDLMCRFGPAYAIRQGRTLSDREQAKAFYLTFGIDVLSAQALKRAEADALSQKVLDWLEVNGFTIPA